MTDESVIGVGATDELSLRVSVATLVRVLLDHPTIGELILALERKATRRETETGPVVEVRSQPFGGALRIHDLETVLSLIPDFHFDSEQSRAEQDFRIFIRPSDWEAVREFCLRHFNQHDDFVLESDPARELAEELADTLKITLNPDQYSLRAVRTIVEDQPSATAYIYARDYPTARVYRIFEARILDHALMIAMIRNNEICSDEELCKLALEDARSGGPGKANAVLTLSLTEVHAGYQAVQPDARNAPIWLHGHQLDETVAAVLEDVAVPKYRRIS